MDTTNPAGSLLPAGFRLRVFPYESPINGRKSIRLVIDQWLAVDGREGWLPLREFWIPQESVKKHTVDVAAMAFVRRFLDDRGLPPRELDRAQSQ